MSEFKGKLIYEPKGRAREYAKLAVNVYVGCEHGCVYCYAPSVMRRERNDFLQVGMRAGEFLSNLAKEAARYKDEGVTDQVLLSFVCDPYQPFDAQIGMTRKVIEVLKGNGLHFTVLTKAGSRALRDLDLYENGDAFGTTLTWLDEGLSLEWEPGAALPQDRIETISRFHEAGINTWVSLEPVLNPQVALKIIMDTFDIVDLYKIGKLNVRFYVAPEFQLEIVDREHSIDWALFRKEAVALLHTLNYRRNFDCDDAASASRTDKQFYIKSDLANLPDK